MSILLDTDVLSAFAKISGLELLNELFSGEEILITNGVYEELTYIKESGYDFADQILGFVRNTPMNDEELDIYHSFLKHTSLGKGELQCIVVCIVRGYPFITNDRKAKNFASAKGVMTWDIPDILKALWMTGIKSKEDVASLMELLERKDMMVIKNKNQILGYATD